jgi:hypothetical protein
VTEEEKKEIYEIAYKAAKDVQTERDIYLIEVDIVIYESRLKELNNLSDFDKFMGRKSIESNINFYQNKIQDLKTELTKLKSNLR